MRPVLPLLALLLATACGAEREESSAPQMEASDVATAPSSSMRGTDAATGPDISPTAAPGVAFNYRYSFRLPAERIAQVQERHAQACEGLGVARCRITGMRYRVVNENDIEAMLAFRLDPAIARRFGQAGVQVVAQADGMLTESEISGTEVAPAIERAGRDIAQMNERLRSIESQLDRRGLSSVERDRLQYEAQQLRQAIRAAEANREDQQASLATTPMVFNYGSGDLVPGFDSRPSFRRELDRAVANFVDGLLILFVVVVTLLPWAFLALLGWWIARLVRRRAGRSVRPGEAQPTTAESEVNAPAGA